MNDHYFTNLVTFEIGQSKEAAIEQLIASVLWTDSDELATHSNEELVHLQVTLRRMSETLTSYRGPLYRELERRGLEDHMHGDGTYASPGWNHAHPVEGDLEAHEEAGHPGTDEERDAQDAIRLDMP